MAGKERPQDNLTEADKQKRRDELVEAFKRLNLKVGLIMAGVDKFNNFNVVEKDGKIQKVDIKVDRPNGCFTEATLFRDESIDGNPNVIYLWIGSKMSHGKRCEPEVKGVFPLPITEVRGGFILNSKNGPVYDILFRGENGRGVSVTTNGTIRLEKR